MTQQEFLTAMDESLELSPGTLNGSEKLADLEMWDSVSMMSYIALADTNGVKISPRHIVNCTTVNDLAKLAEVS